MTASALKVNVGTRITWQDADGDYTMTLKNMANNVGRLGARADLGAYPRPGLYRWYAQAKFQATPTQYNLMRWWLAFWDDESTPGAPWGGVGSSDAAFSTETDALNLFPLRPIIIDAASTSRIMTAGGLVAIPTRYVSPATLNSSGASTTNPASGTYETYFVLTPWYPENQ